MSTIYDPFEFIGKAELFTITMLGSFVTWKLINVMYDQFYVPVVDVVVDSKDCDEYVLKIGNNYVRIGVIINEFIKWAIIIIILMIVYNLITYRR